jgi:hypothetical protein
VSSCLFTSNENDGSSIHISSLEGFGERYPYQIYAGAVIVQQQLNPMLILHNSQDYQFKSKVCTKGKH